MKRPPAPGRSVPRDQGVSLVEVLVGMGLFGLLGTLLLGLALGTGRVTDETRRLTSVNEESRLAMERFARELRQADRIDAYELPSDPAVDPIAVTFWTDFDGDDVRDLGVVDPEVLTYRYRPTSRRLTITVDDADGTEVTRPMLAVNVSAFTLVLYSSLWEHDGADGSAPDGVTTWQELDHAVGNGDGVPDPDELELVDRVGVSMTVLDGVRSQTYRTEIDLRNGIQS